MSQVIPIEETPVAANETAIPMTDTPTTADGSDSSTKVPKARIYFLDNLRTILTLLVVIHHCVWVVVAGWFPFQRTWPVDIPTLVFG